MTEHRHNDRLNALLDLLDDKMNEAESPAYLVAVAKAIAVENHYLGYDAEARAWARSIMGHAGTLDLRAIRAWRFGRASLPWHKRIRTPRTPSPEWVQEYNRFDAYRAKLDIEHALTDLED